MNTIIGKPLTPPKAFFDWCLSHIPTYYWSNKKKTILTSTRKNCPIIKKRLTKNSRLSFPDRFYSFAIFLVSKKRIEIQSYAYWHEIENGKEVIISRLANLERFSKGKHIKAHSDGKNWYEGLLSNYSYMSSAYTNTIFYKNNWREKIINNDDLKYLKLDSVTRYNLANIYKYRVEIEYLQNINATVLANEIIHTRYEYINGSNHKQVDLRVITRNWLKKNKGFLKSENPSFNSLMLRQTLKRRGVKAKKNIDLHLHYKQVQKLPKEVNLTKFQNWAVKQEVSFNYYIDYLNMLDELKIPLNDKSAFPKNLTKSHDELVSTINQLKRELEEQAYIKRKKELKQLEQEIDEFVFLVPKDLQEIVHEGCILHHCVGSKSYLDRHSNGETNIVFIRKKESVHTPYFTMEYQNKKVRQIQGKYNQEEVPKAVQEAVNKWQTKITKAI